MTRRAAAAGAVAISAALLGLAGCGAPSAQTSTGLQLAAAAKCDAGSRQLVESFVASFNSGDALQLDRLFAGPGHGLFEWYSTDAPGERINDVAKDRSSLMAYFAKRHKHRERLELRSFHFVGNQGILGGFEFELIRSADDGLASTPYGGKGAIDCAQSPMRLVVWSMAREPFLRSDVPLYLSLIALLLITLAAGGIAFYRWRRREPSSS